MQIGKTHLNGSPRIALSVTDRESNHVIRKYRVDILELRVDLFRKIGLEDVRHQVLQRKKLGIPMLLTVRNDKAEGALREMSEKKKWAIYEAILPLVHAVDVEIKSPLIGDVVRLARLYKKKVVLSWHNLKMTPGTEVLEKILHTGKRHRGDFVKIATQATSFKDVERLMDFTRRHRSDHIITIAVGDFGSISRLLFPAIGSLLTYCYLGKPVGAGQLSIQILQEHFRMYYPNYR